MAKRYDATGLFHETNGRGRRELPKVQALLKPRNPPLLPNDASWRTTDGEAFARHYQGVRADLHAQFNPGVDGGDNVIPGLYEQAKRPTQVGAVGYIADQGYIKSGVNQCVADLDGDAEKGPEAFEEWADANMAGSRGVDRRKLIVMKLARGESVNVTVTILAKSEAEVDAYRKRCAPPGPTTAAASKKRKKRE